MKNVLIFGLVAAAGSCSALGQTTITRWNFNQSGASFTSPAAAEGPGVASLVGGVVAPGTGGFPSGSGSSDGGSSWSTTGYPVQGTGSGTAGHQFLVSTVGYTDVVFTYDVRSSNTASKFIQVQYTTDGTTFQDAPGGLYSITGTNFNNDISVSFTGVPGVDNNANFGVRIVTVFDPALGNAYSATTATSTYAPASGTLRYDDVVIAGTATVSLPPTGVGAASPGAVCVGEQGLATVTVTSGQNPPSSSYTVTANLSSVGGPSSAILVDDGTNGDLLAGDGVFSFAFTAFGSGVNSIPFSVVDDQNRTGSGSFNFGVGDCSFSSSTAIVISQVYGGGNSGSAPFNADYVELFNRSSAPVDITGYSVQYASSTGSVGLQQVAPISGTIPAGGYYLVQMSQPSAVNPVGDPLPAADAVAPGTQGILMSNITGKVYLSNASVPVTGCDDAAIVDSIGYGPGVNCFEGAGPATALTSGAAAFRKNNGCQDSNQNFNDFEALAPFPRNSASSLNACVAGPTCGTADFDGDGDSGTDADIEAFFACLAGNCCDSCFGADFDGDGDTGTDADIEAFFRVLAGQPC